MLVVFLHFAEQRKLSANMREVSEAPDSPLHGLMALPSQISSKVMFLSDSQFRRLDKMKLQYL
jgi:hypothetical protein